MASAPTTIVSVQPPTQMRHFATRHVETVLHVHIGPFATPVCVEVAGWQMQLHRMARRRGGVGGECPICLHPHAAVLWDPEPKARVAAAQDRRYT